MKRDRLGQVPAAEFRYLSQFSTFRSINCFYDINWLNFPSGKFEFTANLYHKISTLLIIFVCNMFKALELLQLSMNS